MNVSAQNWTRVLNGSERSHQFICCSDPTCSQLNQLLLLCGKPAELLNQLQPGSITAGVLLPSAETRVQPLSRTTRSETRPVNPPEPSCWTFTLNQRCRLNRVLTGSGSDKNPPADQNQVDSGSDPHSLQETEQINTRNYFNSQSGEAFSAVLRSDWPVPVRLRVKPGRIEPTTCWAAAAAGNQGSKSDRRFNETLREPDPDDLLKTWTRRTA